MSAFERKLKYGEIKLYIMCCEYTENELQIEWIAVIILILFC